MQALSATHNYDGFKKRRPAAKGCNCRGPVPVPRMELICISKLYVSQCVWVTKITALCTMRWWNPKVEILGIGSKVTQVISIVRIVTSMHAMQKGISANHVTKNFCTKDRVVINAGQSSIRATQLKIKICTWMRILQEVIVWSLSMCRTFMLWLCQVPNVVVNNQCHFGRPSYHFDGQGLTVTFLFKTPHRPKRSGSQEHGMGSFHGERLNVDSTATRNRLWPPSQMAALGAFCVVVYDAWAPSSRFVCR